MTSNQAATIFKDDHFNFVYIDARHDYTSVLEDLVIWWPKLKKGRVISGHDYIDCDENLDKKINNLRLQPDNSLQKNAVKGVVIEFAKSVKRQISVTYREKEWNT